MRITFREPDTENERYAYLKWHMERVTGRTVIYEMPKRKGRLLRPRTLLRSMLPEGCRINNLAADSQDHTITASVAGLTPDEIQGIQDDFEDESGMTLDLKGQMSLF